MRSILTVVAFLISYGSLFPFNFVTVEDFSGAFRTLLTHISLPENRGDLFGNVVLFIPYGFFTALVAAQSQRPRATRFALVAFGLVLAFALQVVQIWLPSRVAAAGDAIVNAAGLVIGLGLGAWLSHKRLSVGQQVGPNVMVPAALVLLWLAYRWFPWVPTIDLQNMKEAIKPLIFAPELSPVRTLHTALSWLVFFHMANSLGRQALSRFGLIMVALAITLGQLFFVNASISLNNLAGLSLAILALPMMSRPDALVGLSLALLGSLLLSGLQPFELARPPNEFLWIPFSGFLTGSMTTNFLVLLEKTYLYAALIFVMQKSGAQPLPATLICATWLALIEAAQIVVLGRTAESTDALLALLLGYVISKVVQLRPDPSRT